MNKILSRTALACQAIFMLLGPAPAWASDAEDPIVYRPPGIAHLPFSEAVEYGGVLYLSGQIGIDADGKFPDGGMAPQARQIMDNIKGVLAKHDLGMDRVIKCTIFLADMAEWQAFNEVYVSYFEDAKLPARSALAAAGLALGARAEVECMAAK